MKIPRDLSGNELIKLLKKYSYEVTRQSGSHIRLTTRMNGEHHITVPNHSPIKIGTLSAVLAELAEHTGKTKDQIMRDNFS
jgi:predicted RNA binding protein YcfA (HicA-like mRNA interferase family)